jgi:hypothetical protein
VDHVHSAWTTGRWRGTPVHHGSGGGMGGTPHRSCARGRLWAWLLAMRAPRGKGGRGEPHRGRARGWSEAGDELEGRWLLVHDGEVARGMDGTR